MLGGCLGARIAVLALECGERPLEPVELAHRVGVKRVDPLVALGELLLESAQPLLELCSLLGGAVHRYDHAGELLVELLRPLLAFELPLGRVRRLRLGLFELYAQLGAGLSGLVALRGQLRARLSKLLVEPVAELALVGGLLAQPAGLLAQPGGLLVEPPAGQVKFGARGGEVVLELFALLLLCGARGGEGLLELVALLLQLRGGLGADALQLLVALAELPLESRPLLAGLVYGRAQLVELLLEPGGPLLALTPLRGGLVAGVVELRALRR